MQIADLPPAKNSAARERLLETAARIFYAEGINTVGVHRIVEEAGVTLATFYRHFPSKQDLVLAYLQRVHDDFASRAAAAQEAAEDPGDVLRLIATNITAQLLEPGFRGCAFINAASEFEDPDGPVLRAVLAHRAWFYALVRDAFASAGHAQPDLAAGHYVMLRDGATTAGHLGDPSQARDTFERGLAGLLRFTHDPAKTSEAAADSTSSEADSPSSRTSARSR
jgi:AcrR family transcriptional regulator